MAVKFVTNSQEETENLGARLAAGLMSGAVIAFTGDLGAGKTAFTRGLARGLGILDRVTSPTFTIVNENISDALEEDAVLVDIRQGTSDSQRVITVEGVSL